MGTILSCCEDFDKDKLDRRRPERRPPRRPSPGGRGREQPTDNSKVNIGSKVNVYKQDPDVTKAGLRVLWLPVQVRAGPVTDDVYVAGMSRAYRQTDRYTNYLYDPDVDPDAFDSVHSLATVQFVLDMFRRTLRRVRSSRSLHWVWGTRPIQLFPHAGRKSNAYYSRNERALKFFYFQDNWTTVYSCRSWDIVAHEAGHAVLDSLKPAWIDASDHPETGALHEAFGDLTSIFSVIEQLDMCELLVAHTKGDLASRDNLLAAVGEQFGRGVGRHFGLRNASDDLRISDVTEEVHDLSRVFTGAIYDVLVKVFEATLDIGDRQPADTLHRAGRHLLSVLIIAIVESPRRNASFRDIAELMIEREPQEVFKGFLRSEFTRRQIFDPAAQPRRRIAALDRTDLDIHSCCCVTLRANGMKLTEGQVKQKPQSEQMQQSTKSTTYQEQNNISAQRHDQNHLGPPQLEQTEVEHSPYDQRSVEELGQQETLEAELLPSKKGSMGSWAELSHLGRDSTLDDDVFPVYNNDDHGMNGFENGRVVNASSHKQTYRGNWNDDKHHLLQGRDLMNDTAYNGRPLQEADGASYHSRTSGAAVPYQTPPPPYVLISRSDHHTHHTQHIRLEQMTSKSDGWSQGSGYASSGTVTHRSDGYPSSKYRSRGTNMALPRTYGASSSTTRTYWPSSSGLRFYGPGASGHRTYGHGESRNINMQQRLPVEYSKGGAGQNADTPGNGSYTVTLKGTAELRPKFWDSQHDAVRSTCV